jgi:hypothetical protein
MSDAPGDGADRSSRGTEGTGPRRVLSESDPVVFLLDVFIIVLIASIILGIFQGCSQPPSS